MGIVGFGGRKEVVEQPTAGDVAKEATSNGTTEVTTNGALATAKTDGVGDPDHPNFLGAPGFGPEPTNREKATSKPAETDADSVLADPAAPVNYLGATDAEGNLIDTKASTESNSETVTAPKETTIDPRLTIYRQNTKERALQNFCK